MPMRTQWSDVGSWSAVWSALEKDESGNATQGEGSVIFQDTKNSFAYSDLPCLSVVGLEDVLVVAVKDAVLVASKDQAQAVSAVVDKLRAQGRDEAMMHKRVFRPWR